MKEVHNAELMQHFLLSNQLQSIFNDDVLPYVVLHHFEQGELVCTQGEPAEEPGQQFL